MIPWHLAQFQQRPTFTTGVVGGDPTGQGYDVTVSGSSCLSVPQTQGQTSAPVGGNAIVANIGGTKMVMGFNAFLGPDG